MKVECKLTLSKEELHCLEVAKEIVEDLEYNNEDFLEDVIGIDGYGNTSSNLDNIICYATVEENSCNCNDFSHITNLLDKNHISYKVNLKSITIQL